MLWMLAIYVISWNGHWSSESHVKDLRTHKVIPYFVLALFPLTCGARSVGQWGVGMAPFSEDVTMKYTCIAPIETVRQSQQEGSYNAVLKQTI